jgi:NADH:ubiquinone oxidoreductase subunit 6 (subunit J)
MEQAVLYILSGIAAASAVAMIFVRQVFYAALCLLACLLALAGIYGIMHAGFLAITQVLIYAGGVLVLIVFAIVVTNRIEGKPLHVESQHRFIGFLDLSWNCTSAGVGLSSNRVYDFPHSNRKRNKATRCCTLYGLCCTI